MARSKENLEPVVEKQVEVTSPKKLILLRAIHGPMVDQTTGEVYDQQPRVVEKITNFMQCQIDAGKVEVITG